MQPGLVKHTLLLVDADPKSVRILEVSLKKAGFQVVVASTVREALLAMERNAPELVISDTHLPELDGFELCRRIKQRPEWAKIPLIFLTGRKSIEDKIRALELGVEDYLSKPIYIKEMTARVRMLLQRQQRERLESRRDGRTKFAGQLADLSVVDLVQTIELNRKSGIVHVVGRDRRRGAIYFREGRVVDAEVGRLAGPEAVFRLFSWSEGDFEVEFKAIRRKDVVELAPQALLMEGMRRLDEWTRLLERLPPLDTVFEVDYRLLADRLAEIPDEVNGILRLFDGRRTFQQVVEDSDFADLEAANVVDRLLGDHIIHESQSSGGHRAGPGISEEAGRADVNPRLERWLSEGRGSERGDSHEDVTPVRNTLQAETSSGYGADEVDTGQSGGQPPEGDEDVSEDSEPPLHEKALEARDSVRRAVRTAAVVPQAAANSDGSVEAPARDTETNRIPRRFEESTFVGLEDGARRRRALGFVVLGAAALFGGAVVWKAFVRPSVVVIPVATDRAPLPVPDAAVPAAATGETAPALTPAAAGARAACRSAHDAEKHAEARAACVRALHLAPAQPDVMVMLADVALAEEKNAEALRWARKAIDVEPTLPEAYVVIGTVQQLANHDEDAKAAYRKYLELAPEGKYAEQLRTILGEPQTP